MALDPVFGPQFPWLLFFPAIAFAGWFGGLGPGLVTTGLCALVGTYVWLPSVYSSATATTREMVSVAVFCLVGLILSVLNEALRRGRRRFDVLLESMSDGFVVLDRRWRYTYVNPRAAAIARRQPHEMLGHSLWELSPNLVGSAFDREAHEAVRTRTPRRFEFFHAPSSLWIEIRISPSPEGLTMYLQDITERKRAETASGQLAALVQSSVDAIISMDLNGIITSWNPAAEAIFGFLASEAIGGSITIIIPPERQGESRQALERVRRGETVAPFETERVRKDGTRLHVSLTVSPIRIAADRIIGASKISRDISDRKRLEAERTVLYAREQAARSQAEAANRAKDEFLALLSHELRTPLGAIFGWARMLQSKQSDEATTAHAIEVIVRNAQAQAQLLDDLLDVSRVVSGKMRLDVRSVDLLGVVQSALDAIHPAAMGKQIRVEAVLDPHAGPITGDPDRLQQVVWNLLMNAVKFTPKGGRVQVHVQRVNSHVEVVISDTGQGIAADVLPFIFDRFRQGDSTTTRGQGGLGLGLALAKHLVQLHGGTIEVHSAGKGRGATFVVKLPVAVAQMPEESRPRAHPRAFLGTSREEEAISLEGLRVLVVDDNPDALDLVAAILRRAGASVQTSLAAAAAREQLSRWRPDVLISDIEMPGEDGYALIRQIRLEGNHGRMIPALALTAFGRAEDRIRALSAGYNMHAAKPVDPVELTTMVARLAGRSISHTPNP
jgi:PAS domain S-box-containing protein